MSPIASRDRLARMAMAVLAVKVALAGPVALAAAGLAVMVVMVAMAKLVPMAETATSLFWRRTLPFRSPKVRA